MIITLLTDESVTQLVTSHHDTPLPDKVCDIDVDFQSSTSHMGIQWSRPANVTTLVTSVKWGIQEQVSRYGNPSMCEGDLLSLTDLPL